MFPGKPCRTFMNSDSRTLPCIQIDEAITAPRADSDHVVLGPSFDGGYDLIGLKGFHPELFPNIVWSTPGVFCRHTQARGANGPSGACAV